MNANEREWVGQEDAVLTDLAKVAAKAIADLGIHARVKVVASKGSRPPKGFPPGDLMRETSDGRLVWSYSALAVLNFIARVVRVGKK